MLLSPEGVKLSGKKSFKSRAPKSLTAAPAGLIEHLYLGQRPNSQSRAANRSCTSR